MSDRDFGLIPNRSTPDRYIRLVRWEGKWVPCIDEEGQACEEYRARPMVWEWSLLDVRHGAEVQKHWVPTDISTARLVPPAWPRGLSGESEALRRIRIRALRRAVHLDEGRGGLEPDWVEAPSAAAHQ